MVKEYRACCDGGCFCIGNESVKINIPNGYGDCSQSIFVSDGDISGIDGRRVEKANWIGSIHGRVRIYSYDCIHNGKDEEEYRLDEFEGVFDIYLYKGDWWNMCEPELYLIKRK